MSMQVPVDTAIYASFGSISLEYYTCTCINYLHPLVSIYTIEKPISVTEPSVLNLIVTLLPVDTIVVSEAGDPEYDASSK